MNPRETAWRLFSKEFNSATLDIGSTEERAPSYVVTSLGAKVNRLLVVGVVTETENVGNEESPMIRARLADPSGSYYLSAGQFQADAMKILRELKPPEFVAVVGKAKVYAPDDTVRLLSVRPEAVKRCDAKMRDHWIYETCVATLGRIEIMREAMEMSSPSVDELVKLKYPAALAEGAVAAIKHYQKPDLDSYEDLVREALKEIVASGSGYIRDLDVEEMAVQPEAGDVEVAEAEKIIVSDDEEETVLKLVKSLDKDGKGAKWDEIVASAKKKKIEKERLEEICTELLDKGDIYEPELGRMKTI